MVVKGEALSNNGRRWFHQMFSYPPITYELTVCAGPCDFRAWLPSRDLENKIPSVIDGAQAFTQRGEIDTTVSQRDGSTADQPILYANTADARAVSLELFFWPIAQRGTIT
jgi:hypothetical protein